MKFSLLISFLFFRSSVSFDKWTWELTILFTEFVTVPNTWNNFKVTPTDISNKRISNARAMREIIKGRPAKAKGSITRRRQRDGSLIGTFTRIDGDFSIRVTVRDK